MSNYITLKDVREYLDVKDEDASSYALIETLIAQVQAIVETEKCGRTFGSSVFTEILDGDGCDSVLLKQYPIIELQSIWDDLGREYGEDTELDVDDIAVYEDEGKLVFVNNFFQQGKKNIKVVYRAGYATIPADLKLALIKFTAAEYLMARTQINVVKSDGEGFDIEDRPRRMKLEAEAVFKQYRKII